MVVHLTLMIVMNLQYSHVQNDRVRGTIDALRSVQMWDGREGGGEECAHRLFSLVVCLLVTHFQDSEPFLLLKATCSTFKCSLLLVSIYYTEIFAISHLSPVSPSAATIHLPE